MFGHSGHGFSAARASGGAGSSSSWRHRCGTLAMHGAEAVRAGVAAADDDDVLAGGGDRAGLGTSSPWQRRFCCVRYSIAKWMPGELAARHREVARAAGAAGEQHGIEVAAQIGSGDVDADVHAGAEHHALGLQQVEPPIEDALLQLELGDAVAQQSADAIGFLEHRDAVAGAIELRRRGQPGRARADRPPPSSTCAWSAAPARSSLRRTRDRRSPARST